MPTYEKCCQFWWTCVICEVVGYKNHYKSRGKKKKNQIVVCEEENMSSISIFHCVYLMFLLSCISKVRYGKMVFNVMNYGAVADGNTDNSKVIFTQ